MRWLDLCAVERAEADQLLTYFAPLADADHLSAIVEIKLNKLRPMVISRAAESVRSAWIAPHHSAQPSMWRLHALYEPAANLMRVIDTSPDRWVSSRARSHFKTLLEDARERPQVVEREGDDLVVVSRRYLQETVDPTSAKGLSRRYLAMGLSDDDMPVLQHGRAPALDDLPEIGPA